MSKTWKLILWIGIPVVLVLLVVGIYLSQSRTVVGDYQMVESGLGVRTDNMTVTKGESFAGVPMVAPTAADDSLAKVVSNGNATNSAVDRLIIKTGSLSMVVEDVRQTIGKISKYAEDKGGFVVTSNEEKSGVSPYGEITIRIPAKVFDSGVADVKQMGQVESERVDGQDVTEEYVDLDAQLNNLRASEAQFLQIMQRAVKIEDVLAVQRELTNVRSNIERIQGRMKYLKQSADLSTLTVYLSTDPSVLPSVDNTNKWRPWAEVKAAARNLVALAKILVNVIIWFIVYIPLWLVIGLVVWGVVRFIRKRRTV